MTPKFLTGLFFEDQGGLPLILERSLVYDSALVPVPITVPAGFKTDLASIPRVLWNVLPPIGKYDAAAVVHDYCYARAPQDLSRDRADAILREAMQVLGVGAWTRWIIYAGVRVGGWSPWGAYRRRDQGMPPPEIAA